MLSTRTHAIGDRSAGRDNATVESTLLDLKQVAGMLGCSARHVRRLADDGRMPAPVHLGTLIRFRRADVEAWIEGGCQPVRRTSNAKGSKQ